MVLLITRSFTSLNVAMSAISNRVAFGNGCYWGTEKYIFTDFGKKLFPGSIKAGKVGFMHPTVNFLTKKNPTYREVCSGSTGYVEVYDCEFNGDEATFENLVRHTFMFHDPTTADRQGNDRGTQYASAIFCYDDKQMEIAQKIKDELQSFLDNGKLNCFDGKKVSTNIYKATEFYPAMTEHQEYLDKNPFGYCNHRYRFNKWPTK